MNPSIVTVTGCPCTKNNQGLVEIMKIIAKRINNKTEEEHPQIGNVISWTMYLGIIMAAINSMEKRRLNGLSSYEAIYRISFGGVEQYSMKQLCSCSTVSERLQLV
jgi:hypothetical protein